MWVNLFAAITGNIKSTVKGTVIPVQALRVPRGSDSEISRQSAHEGCKVVSPTHRPPLTLGNTPGTHLYKRLSRRQGYNAAGRVMSIKNSSDTIGKRTRDLLACSTMPQPSAPYRVPKSNVIYSKAAEV